MLCEQDFNDKIFLGLKVHTSELGFMAYLWSFVILVLIQRRIRLSLSAGWSNGGGLRMQFYSFLTCSSCDKWSTSRPVCFTAGKEPPVPTDEQIEWALQSVWEVWKKKKSLSVVGIGTPGHSACSFALYRLHCPDSCTSKNISVEV